MKESANRAFSSYTRRLLMMMENERSGDNNQIIIDKYTELISSLRFICDSFIEYLNGQKNNFDTRLVYFIDILLCVLNSYLGQLESSKTEINKVFPLKWSDDDFYDKEIDRVNRLIKNVVEKKNKY
jgi:hypothetical protein